ncbi:hypothetical protein Tco_0647985 [Tanacetum coccineum]
MANSWKSKARGPGKDHGSLACIKDDERSLDDIRVVERYFPEHLIVTFSLRPDFGGVTDGTRAKNPSSLSDIHARVFLDPYLLFRLS